MIKEATGPVHVARSDALPHRIQTVADSILGSGKNPFLEIGHEITSMAILSPLIQVGQLSVTGERISTHNQQFVSWVYLYLITAAAENTLISVGNTFSTCVFFESKINRTSVQTDCTILVFSK